MKQGKYIAKPFVKWVGGKTRLIDSIEQELPLKLKEGTEFVYVEPFVGGGAVLFWILQKYPNVKHAIINDINPDLINAYSVVKFFPHELISVLKQIEEIYKTKSESERKQYYLQQRDRFNSKELEPVESAAVFIFLNRTCFNGLYRVNSRGDFNVPFGRYTNPTICDAETIWADSQLLQRVTIFCGDFKNTLKYNTPQTFFYLDPPYKPISPTSAFTAYTKEGFGDREQYQLCEFCNKIVAGGGCFVLSNSDATTEDGKQSFFEKIYTNFSIRRVGVMRSINAKAETRGVLNEVLITHNY
ncbi:MAG: DNA adenine methylase [Tidjanibacter sp.]|nr:DNA adenine methylase [Tidjanibacter sp.]